MTKQQGMKRNNKAQSGTIGQGKITRHEIKVVGRNKTMRHKARRANTGSK
jgi:hypothetical protein